MKFINTFERFELKYMLSTAQRDKLFNLMKLHMVPDEFGKSKINSLYFDTPSKLIIRKSIENKEYKEKLRLRCYGDFQSEKLVFLELKKKYNGVVYKRRISMTMEEAQNFIKYDEVPNLRTQILKELRFFLNCHEDIEPSVLISCDREAFFAKSNSDFRMTFDTGISANYDPEYLYNYQNGENLISSNQVLLEVKTALGLPLWLRNFLLNNNIYQTSFSKYKEAYKKSLDNKVKGVISDVA